MGQWILLPGSRIKLGLPCSTILFSKTNIICKDDFHLVQWDGFETASAFYPKMYRVWLMKHVSNLAGIMSSFTTGVKGCVCKLGLHNAGALPPWGINLQASAPSTTHTSCSNQQIAPNKIKYCHPHLCCNPAVSPGCPNLAAAPTNRCNTPILSFSLFPDRV